MTTISTFPTTFQDCSSLSAGDIRKLREKIRSDPPWFLRTALKMKLWAKQEEIALSVRDHQETAVRSCNSSGKTFIAAGLVHWWLMAHEESVVVTTAPTGRQVREVLWREIRGLASGRRLYPSKSVQEVQIDITPKWFAIGLSTDAPDQLQGFHSPHLLVIVDEASGVMEPIYQAIDGLKPERILLIGNPLSNEGRFARDFAMPGISKIRISAFDTPNLKEGRVVWPGLVTQEEVNRLRDRYGEDSDVYRVRVMGEFPAADSTSLIAVGEIASAMERRVDPGHFEKKMGVDVARFGDDRTAVVIRQANKVTRKETWSGRDLMQTTGEVLRIAKEEKVLPGNVFIDSIGAGAGVVDRLREQGWRVSAVNVAEKAKDDEQFLNLRAEIFHALKEWIASAELPRDDDFYELSAIRYKFTSRGQLQIESKEDMKKRGLASPDIADALALTMASPARVVMQRASDAVKPFYSDIGF